jgi:hypothetical protein
MLATEIKCLDTFHQAGWTIGDTAIHASDGSLLVWVVSGCSAGNWIRAEGATSAKAWLAAVEQARSKGMLRAAEA